MNSFSVDRDSNIFSIRSDKFWLKNFVNTNLKIILKDKFQSGACNVNPLLRNLGYDNNSTQNQNVFQTLQEINWALVLEILHSLMNPFHKWQIPIEERLEPYN